MNDDWVARLLAGSERPVMPADVADRLERTVRDQIAGGAAAVDPVEDGDVAQDPVAGGPVLPAPAAEAPAGRAPVGASDGSGHEPSEPAPVPSDNRPVERPVTGSRPGGATDAVPAPAAPAPAVPSPAVPSPAVPSPAVPSPAVPSPAVVPPTAGAGASAPLRAGGSATEGGSGTGQADDELARARAARPAGTSRREQRADDQGERRRRLLTRWVPVAAGVLVLGAAGIAAVNVLDGSGADTTAADELQEASAGAAAESVAPRSLVATGTEYTTADPDAFAQQVRELVALASTGDGTAAATPQEDAPQDDADAGTLSEGADDSAAAGGDVTSARAEAAGSPLADPAALTECIEAVTEGADDSAAAVDLAVVDGVESTVVVVPDPAGERLFVYVVGPDCSAVDTQFDFFNVVP
ncbi:hypothetical protein [Jannaschia sp. R86511]|uniref:hypothetical protein n=1 Tax=Jannaschia sp. R86511 TaxID=3093853 RepID=UPI0036D399CB